MSNIIGIYKITSPTNKIYIGQSWDVVARIRRYKNLKCQRQVKVHSSLLKYGTDNHVFEILHVLPKDVKQEVLNTLEIFCIDQYKESGAHLLNLQSGGYNGRHSQETKDKIRKANTGVKFSEERIKNLKQGQRNYRNGIVSTKPAIRKKTSAVNKTVWKPVIQYTLKGDFVAEHLNIRQAAFSLNLKKSDDISLNAKLKISHAHRFIWRFKEEGYLLKVIGLTQQEIDFIYKDELVGCKFHRLLVLMESIIQNKRDKRWMCVCDCGTIKDVLASQLKNGKTKSCGCYNREVASERMRKNKKQK